MVGLETSQLLQFFLWTNQDKLLSKVMCVGGYVGSSETLERASIETSSSPNNTLTRAAVGTDAG
jgi:hypothetical protein